MVRDRKQFGWKQDEWEITETLNDQRAVLPFNDSRSSAAKLHEMIFRRKKITKTV